MEIKEIKIAELPDFVTSELWLQLHPKPITILRAISQFNNPNALPDDLALIIAYDENALVGLVGILPHMINGSNWNKASSNTCWWADANKGKKVAIPLFMKAFSHCGQRMFMTDMTPHTLSILEKTAWFEFPITLPGIRGFLKFNLHEVIPAKLPVMAKYKPLLKLSNQAINLLFAPFMLINRARVKGNNIKIERLSSLTEELHNYIENHSQNEWIHHSGAELEWIIQYPWIKTKNDARQSDLYEYPFSHLVNQFEQYFLHLSVSGKTIGLLLISVRDGHMKVPYAYFEEKDAALILQVIYRQALLKNAVTLTLFLPALVNVMRSAPHPFVFRKRIKRMVAISKQLADLFARYPKLQDGDGDVVFT